MDTSNIYIDIKRLTLHLINLHLPTYTQSHFLLMLGHFVLCLILILRFKRTAASIADKQDLLLIQFCGLKTLLDG
jgi:hypothetical protein